MMKKCYLLCLAPIVSILGCKNDDSGTLIDCVTDGFFSEYNQRDFEMGFTSWSFGPEAEDVASTYDFISNNGDIYVEHIDNSIPWNAWINNTTLPESFSSEITFRVSNKINDSKLLLSISPLNLGRDDLAEDLDGMVPAYMTMNDQHIEDAYFRHVDYLVSQLQPDYLLIAIEANELWLHSVSKWHEYKLLIQSVKARIQQKYPSLQISESMTLHTLFQPDIANPADYVNEMIDYMNQMDFVSISHYPYFKDQHTADEFQEAFNFLHSKINRPIAFTETANIAEDLSLPNDNIFITGNECEQNAYLETLLTNAQEYDYEFIIWWAHRDFDALWETFPENMKDIGKIWRDTGLLDETGEDRPAKFTWSTAFSK